MEVKTTEQMKKQAKILSSKCQNIVQLCEQKDDNGKDFFFVRVAGGKMIFWVSFDELDEIMFQFRDIVNLKRGRKKI